MKLGQLPRAVRLTQAGNRKMRMEGSHFPRKTGWCTFIFKGLMKLSQLAGLIFDSDPEHARLAMRWERAAIADDQIKAIARAGRSSGCQRKGFDFRHRNLTEKFQSKMKILRARPTGANV